MSRLKAAFEQVIKEARNPETWYVTLVAEVPYYGGPEEGGWWGTDRYVEAYKEFPSEELADAAVDAVYKMAEELSAEARREYGDQCQRETEWLDERGLDDSFLPEPDGPVTYRVVVSQTIQQNRRGCRTYS